MGVVNIVSEPCRDYRFPQSWERATLHFKRIFFDNEFGHECNVCGRIWFQRVLRPIGATVATFLAEHFPEENTINFKLCANCFKNCKSQKIPRMSQSNGFRYPPKPPNLPELDVLTERLIVPRLPFLNIRRLRREGSYGIVGQIINVPVDVDSIVRCLPRHLDQDQAFNVNLKRNIIHKSSYLSGYVKKSTIETWQRYSVEQPLHKYYNITIDWSVFSNFVDDEEPQNPGEELIESLGSNEEPESEVIHALQRTMLFNEAQCLDIAPFSGYRKMPIVSSSF